MNKLERGVMVQLWSGWKVNLPPAYFEQNEDGSWSAWGADWTLDISIIDTSGDADGNAVTALQLRGAVAPTAEIEGECWIGSYDIKAEVQNNNGVHRLSAKLCAQNTVMLCTLSFFNEGQVEFAKDILASIEHVQGAGLTG